MGDTDNERLRGLEAQIAQHSEALLVIQDQLIEERSRNAALKLTVFTLVGTLILNKKLKLGDVLNGLAEAERQADPTDPIRAALAHEVQGLRSELGRLLTPTQGSLSRGVLATLQRGLRSRRHRALQD
jgi:hypothetical protein